MSAAVRTGSGVHRTKSLVGEIELRNKRAIRLLALGATAILVLSACSSGGATTAPSSGGGGGSMDALIAAAKAEGGLTTIALPHSWCNYGELLTNFTAKYGIPVNELNPDGSSQQELDAITANKSNKGPAAPDIVDIGLGLVSSAKSDGLITPYKVSTWNDIPDSAKDADGAWYGDYYGVLAFEINTSVVKTEPKDWSDLLTADYKNQVALAGDPTGSNQAISAVWAAAIANGGSLDNAQPGLDWFKKLNDAGNFVPVIGKTATVAQGETPIRIAWTYNALADKDKLAGNPPIDVVVPTSGRFGGMYAQAISAYAPHPNAAKLWEEYLYSDEGQIGWLKGYCTPIRMDALTAANAVPADIAAKLPDTSGTQLPTLDQITKATDTITTGWPTTVGVTVK
jgi:putative spermidine/putrescine transport system substrate-binding protein